MCITRKYVIFTGPSVNNYNFWNYMNSRVNKEKNIINFFLLIMFFNWCYQLIYQNNLNQVKMYLFVFTFFIIMMTTRVSFQFCCFTFASTS